MSTITIDDFSLKERQTIDRIMRQDLSELTTDEIALRIKWEKYLAANDAETQAKIEEMKAASKAALELQKEVAAAAKKNMNSVKNAALKRLAEVKRYD